MRADRATSSDWLPPRIDRVVSAMQSCRIQFDAFLEAIRNTFPRFRLLSNSELLVLSLQDHLVDRTNPHNPLGALRVTSEISAVELRHDMVPGGLGPAVVKLLMPRPHHEELVFHHGQPRLSGTPEVYLPRLLEAVKHELRHRLAPCLQDAATRPAAQWARDHFFQTTLAVMNLRWVGSVEAAFEAARRGSRHALRDCHAELLRERVALGALNQSGELSKIMVAKVGCC